MTKKALSHAGPLPQSYPQPAVGTIPGSAPSDRISSEMSRIHLVYPGALSNMNMANSAARCASAIQPFFSRCGQSVGMLWKLLLYDQRVASKILAKSVFDDENW